MNPPAVWHTLSKELLAFLKTKSSLQKIFTTPNCETLAVNLTVVSRHGVLCYLSTTKTFPFSKKIPFQKKELRQQEDRLTKSRTKITKINGFA